MCFQICIGTREVNTDIAFFYIDYRTQILATNACLIIKTFAFEDLYFIFTIAHTFLQSYRN